MFHFISCHSIFKFTAPPSFLLSHRWPCAFLVISFVLVGGIERKSKNNSNNNNWTTSAHCLHFRSFSLCLSISLITKLAQYFYYLFLAVVFLIAAFCKLYLNTIISSCPSDRICAMRNETALLPMWACSDLISIIDCILLQLSRTHTITQKLASTHTHTDMHMHTHTHVCFCCWFWDYWAHWTLRSFLCFYFACFLAI